MLKLLTCCLVLQAVTAQQQNGQHQNGATDVVANNLLSALTDFIKAHSEEMSEEMQTELDHVQIALEQQKNRSEQLENEIQYVAEQAVVGPKCDGIIVGSFCYVLLNQKLGFDVANTACSQKDGLLASIGSERHYNQVMEYILQHNVLTDRAVVFVWTGLQLEDDDGERFFRWLPSYPRETTSYNHISWQIISSINYGDHGYLNVPNFASAYPLCQQRLAMEIAITCPVLTAPTNGNAPNCSDSNNFGSVCTFTCSDGFAIVGSSTLTCSGDGSSTNGTYDNDPPTCEVDNCYTVGDDEVCLSMGREKLSKLDAANYCTRQGASLVQYETEDEYNVLLNFAKAASGNSSGEFWTDFYRQSYGIYMRGIGVWVPYRNFKDNLLPDSFIVGSTVSIAFADDEWSSGMSVSDPESLFTPICRTPVYEIDEHCFEKCCPRNGTKMCLFLGRDELNHTDATDFCSGKGGKLVDIEDKNLWEEVLNYGRHHSRATFKQGWNRRLFWTNMQAFSMTQVVTSEGNPAYTQWIPEEEIEFDPSVRRVAVGVSELSWSNRGIINEKITDTYYPMCMKDFD